MESLSLSGSRFKFATCICAVLLFLSFATACSVAEPKATANSDTKQISAAVPANAAAGQHGATIPIEPNGPADTVRVFYKLLRDKKFREAIFLTNLKPAIASLTDEELKDFALDLESISGQVPAEVEINGEIITGDQATVTVKLPKADSDDVETQPVKLKKAGEVWEIITVDDEAANRIKKEGNNYVHNLRIDTHQDEARKMLERISKAQIAHSLQNGGTFADLQTLLSSGLLADDAGTSDSTGYNYAIDLQSNNKYLATATPAEYGKSGKLSYLLYLDDKGRSHVSSKDTGGKPMRR